MTTALAAVASTLDKLIRRLGSSHDGERLATVHAIERVMKTAGRDWHDLPNAIVAPPLAPEKPTGDWRSVARFCAARARFLRNDRERDFVATLARYRTEPSKKQLQWLRSIAARLSREAAA
jgi:hypothetical protein